MYKMYPFHFHYKCINLDYIEKTILRKYNLHSSFCSWGIGGIFKRNFSSYTIKGNEGIEIQLQNGKVIFLGTAYPQKIVELIKQSTLPKPDLHQSPIE